MYNGQKIRQKLFWLTDILKGSPIKTILRITTCDLESNSLDELNKKNKNKLTALLNHAVSTTESYKKFSSYNSLEDFPIVNKNVIRDNFKDFISNKIELKKCVKVSTSGSTGAPFAIYQNEDKVNKNIADNIFFSSKSNYEVGSYLIYIKIWSAKMSYKMRISFIKKNMYPCSVFNLSNVEIDNLIGRLNKIKTDICFIGYASALEKICKHLDELNENPVKFKIKSLITISESLNSYTREAAKKHFGVFPLSRYSNNENGIIAQQIRSDYSRFRINDSSYVIEIFDLNEDKKLGFGESGRIIVTDLYNLATPMIRYDTGDVGTMILVNDKPYFSEIHGRKLDLLYDTKGRLVPSHLSAKLCNYGDFKQFQLVQKGLKDYEINLNTNVKVNENKMIKEFTMYFGLDSNIKINYVNDIPLLGSGKRREVVNEYYVKQ